MLCTVTFYEIRMSPTYCKQRCRCNFHGIDFLSNGQSVSGLKCPVGHIEDRLMATQILLENADTATRS